MIQQKPFPGGIAPTISKLILALSLIGPALSLAQSNMTIYADSRVNGWSDGSYNVTLNYANTSPVHSGSDSISVTITGAYGGIQLNHSSMTNTAFANISFWLHGGIVGGQQLQMYGNLSTGTQSARYHLAAPLANQWQQYTVALSALGVANATNFTGFALQDAAGSSEPTFYLDDIQLNAIVPPPTVVHFAINAGLPLRTADTRWFGLNAAMWDNFYDTPTTVSLLNEEGTHIIRLPGGSNSDDYHWLYNQEDTTNLWTWVTSLANFIHVITNASVNAQVITTVNYGTGTPQEAAAWVAYCNAATTNSVLLGVDANGTNWQTAGYWASLRAAAPLGTDDGKNFLRISRTAPLGFKYWEIGNECYGGWEIDQNAVTHDPYTYALRATNYIGLMKAVDPTIKIGVVSAPGEDTYANNTSHPAFNPREGVSHNGWTPVMLATLSSSGVTPDFLVDHFYAESGSDNDQALLQASVNWASDASNLRQQITDYIGSPGTNMELLATENNADSGPEGKQSTSLVDGLYLADSLAQLTKTEFNSFIWWDLRNSTDTSGDFSASLYGWRTNGDLGVIGNLNTLYPTFYTFKLMQHFVQPGDTVLTAASDYSLLSVYATRRQDGALTVLAINKDPSNTYTGQVAVAGFVPAASGTIYSYGIPQDNAAEFGIGSPDIAQTNLSGAGTNFNYAFPPYSATVLSLSPAPATLLALPVPPAASQFVIQLQGQAGVPYVIQNSTNLVTWTSISTNTPLASTINVTNSVDPSLPMQFWRAIWQP
jgi:alpha-N-arabinofuranosidase